MKWRDVHAVGLCYGANMVGGGDGTCDGGLLFVVGKALACEEGRAALGDLDDDRGLDVTGWEIRWRKSGDGRGG